MKKLIVISLLVIGGAVSAFAAKGDKPNQMVLSFRNVSSSTKPANCVVGEMKRNDAYVFMCASSSKWRRIAIGEGF